MLLAVAVAVAVMVIVVVGVREKRAVTPMPVTAAVARLAMIAEEKTGLRGNRTRSF
jgi:hypothetical protein